MVRDLPVYFVIRKVHNSLNVKGFLDRKEAKEKFRSWVENIKTSNKAAMKSKANDITETPTTWIYPNEAHIELVTLDLNIKILLKELYEQDLTPDCLRDAVGTYLGVEALG